MAAIDCLNTLTLPLPQVALTIIKVIQWTRTSTMACSCLLLLLLLLMMRNTWLRHACQLVDCRLLLPRCRRPVVVATANLASVWKRLLAVVVTAANACCAVFPVPLPLATAVTTDGLHVASIKCVCLSSCHRLLLPLPLPSLPVVTSSYKKRILFPLFSLPAEMKYNTLAEDDATFVLADCHLPTCRQFSSRRVAPVARELGIAAGLVTVTAAATTSKLKSTSWVSSTSYLMQQLSMFEWQIDFQRMINAMQRSYRCCGKINFRNSTAIIFMYQGYVLLRMTVCFFLIALRQMARF